MKKINPGLIALLVLGTCALNPFTAPPPSLDFSDPENVVIVDDLVQQVEELDLKVNGVSIVIDAHGNLYIPSSVISEEYQNIVPINENGDVVLLLHTVIVQDSGDKHLVYKLGNTYIGVVFDDDKLIVKNTPTIDYGTIDWNSDGVFEMTVSPAL